MNNGEIECLDGFYTALSKLSKPKIKGKALRDKKKRSGQKAYQREQLGDGFIDNPPLISAAKSAALALADDDAGEDEGGKNDGVEGSKRGNMSIPQPPRGFLFGRFFYFRRR